MERILRFSTILLALGVAAGAFGAHGLKAILSETDMDIWEKAVHYQLFHALAVLMIGAFSDRFIALPRAKLLGTLMIVATCIFSGSLYLLVLLNQRWLGAVTPIGGLGFIIGWILLAVSIRKG
jgi:uncharacterized membrane protein YgdD (TMEM256/DUF423 family)